MFKITASRALSLALAVCVVAFLSLAVRLTVTAATATIARNSALSEACKLDLDYCPDD